MGLLRCFTVICALGIAVPGRRSSRRSMIFSAIFSDGWVRMNPNIVMAGLVPAISF